MKSYIVIIRRAFGGGSVPVQISSYSDLKEFDNRQEAITHGFETINCDDFNIGVVEDGKLTSLDWMDKSINEKPDVIDQISEAIGL